MSAERGNVAGPLGGERAPIAMALVGMSEKEICGVRDHTTMLAQGLRAVGVSCTTHWLRRSATSWRGERAEFREWLAALLHELRERPPDAIVLQYSVFEASHRGVPVHVRVVHSTLRRARVPIIVVGHELAFPFGRGGWRGRLWAMSQRAALLGVVRDSAALVLTTDFRARWLSTRRWLPTRPIAVAPVFSNLPPPRAGLDPAAREGEAIGLFGYDYRHDVVSIVVDAVSSLRQSRPRLRVVLLGAPGADSRAGRHWLALARARGLADAIEFSGTLPAQELSDAIAASDVLLCIDPPGPTARKGSLAASLASGRAVVAIDGPQSWQELVRADALRLVQPSADGLCAALDSLLGDAAARAALGERGRAFHDREMSVAVTTRAVLDLYEIVHSDAGHRTAVRLPSAAGPPSVSIRRSSDQARQ